MSFVLALVCAETDTPDVEREWTPPFGLLSAATVAQRAGCEVRVCHVRMNDEGRQRLRQTCRGADAVGLSVMTTPNLTAALEATALLKEDNCFTFWGGPHATLLPEVALSHPAVDAVLRGEAERTLPLFISWRLGKARVEDVPGLCVRTEAGAVRCAAIPELVGDQQLMPHAYDRLDLSPYLRVTEHRLSVAGRSTVQALPFVTSKGCRMRCSFCYNQAVHRGTWRGPSLDQVFSAMDGLLEQYPIGGWYFYDDNFFGDVERAWAILERYRLPSFVEVPIHRIEQDFVHRALDAGVARVYLGGESGCDETLKRLHKAQSVASIRRAVELCSRAGLPAEVSLMICLPGETPTQMQQTFEFAAEIRSLRAVSVDGPKVFNPYPGTQLFAELCRRGWSPPRTNEGWARFSRQMVPRLAGFDVTPGHQRLIDEHGLGHLLGAIPSTRRELDV